MDSLGQVLRDARERRGLSLTEVALDTNIQSPRLEAIENDDYSRLPPPVYVKGFIRTYAKYLSLDPEPLVQEYLDRHAPKDFQPALPKEPPHREEQDRGGTPAPTPRKGPGPFQQVIRRLQRIPPIKVALVAGLLVAAWLVALAVGRVFSAILDREPEPVEQLAEVPSTLVKMPPAPYFNLREKGQLP